MSLLLGLVLGIMLTGTAQLFKRVCAKALPLILSSLYTKAIVHQEASPPYPASLETMISVACKVWWLGRQNPEPDTIS